MNSAAQVKPGYCHYASGPCDQSFDDALRSECFFVYASKPRPIADALQHAAELGRGSGWRSWKDLDIGGRMVFCAICKALRFADCVIADVTTLNFNVLFEMGYALGLGAPVVPVRDSSYALDQRLFDQLGILDTLGYVDFDTGDTLARLLGQKARPVFRKRQEHKLLTDVPIYMVLPERSTEGSAAFEAVVKKSHLGFRAYERTELPRLSLHEAERQIGGSLGFFSYLVDPARADSTVHNAMCAFLAGMALSRGQVVALVQENSESSSPIDYRDLVKPHDLAKEVEPLLRDAVARLALDTADLRLGGRRGSSLPEKLIERVDLGDLAAENEIRRLPEYFVPTGQSALAYKGHARMVIGRKGSGKTAIFYAVREYAWKQRRSVVLDLKPESHQFARLRDFVRDEMPEGLALHTMVAFWNYLLLTELARRILNTDRTIASRDPKRLERYEVLVGVYAKHDPGVEADFSQRLHSLVARLVQMFKSLSIEEIGEHLTELVFLGDVRELRDAVGGYLEQEKDAVWVLMDNLDKGLPTRGATEADILIVKGLLEATRKLQRQVENLDVDYHCLVFLRNDIYEQLILETSDKGKDTAITLDWDDPELFAEIVRRRVVSSTELTSVDFRRNIWPNLCVTHIGVTDSFDWMLERTLMRPRDLLFFLREAMAVAINRNHKVIKEDDLLHAELGYSEDQLLMLSFELQQTAPEFGDLVFNFEGSKPSLDSDALEETLCSAGLTAEARSHAVDLLLWYGFLGVHSDRTAADVYAHQAGYNMRRLVQPLSTGKGHYVVHPMFRRALGMSG